METEITTNDLKPGLYCPKCDKEIVTWRGIAGEDSDAFTGDYCFVDVEKVEPVGLMSNISGDKIIIVHEDE